MTQDFVNVFHAALSLPEKDRAELAGQLLDSLDEAVDRDEIDKAWAEEAMARLKAYDEGRMKGIPLEDVLRKLKQGSAP
jgi:putative addiction module component (TIGR02574 family)